MNEFDFVQIFLAGLGFVDNADKTRAFFKALDYAGMRIVSKDETAAEVMDRLRREDDRRSEWSK